MQNPSSMLALSTLVSSCFAMATAGAMFSFSVVANSLKDRLNISSTDLNTITAVGNSSLYLSFLAVGPVYDRVGARWTLILGAVIYCLGYALMYLGYEHKIASTTAAMSVYYFIVGIGSTCSYMGCIGANVKNFNGSPHEGKVLGLLLLFYGLSASLFAQLANAFFADRGAGALLLFSAAVCGIVNLLAGCFTFEVAIVGIAVGAQVGEAHGNRSASVQDSAISPAASIRPNGNGEVSRIATTKPGVATELKISDSAKVEDSVHLSPIAILRHPLFWCLSATFVFMQGLTYITNFVTILEAAVGEREATEHADRIITQNSMQVTVMSVFNSLGRLTLPIFCEALQKRQFATLDRSMLLLACQVLIFIPTATLATGAGSEVIFYMSSIFISYGFGGAGALFPVLTKDFFGMQAYGTACAFVMAGVPIGIFISNVVFGRFYDSEAVAASKCYNSACYSKAYIVFSVLQGIAILSAGSVVALRLRMDGQAQISHPKRKLDEEEGAAAAKKSGALPTILQSPAIKKTFAPAEVSPMRDVEESTNSTLPPNAASSKKLLFGSAKPTMFLGRPSDNAATWVDDWKDNEKSKIIPKPATPTNHNSKPIPSGSAFGASSNFGAIPAHAVTSSKPETASPAPKPDAAPKTEKNPFGSVAFGDAGRTSFAFGSASPFGSSSSSANMGGFGAAAASSFGSFADLAKKSETTAKHFASPAPGPLRAAASFTSSSPSADETPGGAAKVSAHSEKEHLAAPEVSEGNNSISVEIEAPKKVTNETDSTTSNGKATTPVKSFSSFGADNKNVTFGGSLGGRETEQIGGSDALGQNATVKAVSFSSAEPAFGSKASAGMSFGDTKSATTLTSFDALLKSTPSKPQSSLVTKNNDDDDEGGAASGDEDVEHEVAIEKRVDMPAIEVKTGEEGESNVFHTRCKLFRMDESNTWKERGMGSLRLNCDDTNTSARLVMRSEGALRLILNVRVLPGMPCQIVQEKYVQFACCEDASGDKLTRFLVKTGNGGAASKLLKHIREFST
ncbi:hypothetical protein HDU81_001417 [Chytriomyces hyalinus]|nr:hypothetical protein HDU81_001417 [Chytriomyces hyalinus]